MFEELKKQFEEAQLKAEEEKKLATLDEIVKNSREAAQMFRVAREEAFKAFREEGFPDDIAEEMALDMVRAGLRQSANDQD